MNIDSWIAKHPYLENIARFEQLIEDALDSIPLANSADEGVTKGYRELVARLSKLDLPETLAAEINEISRGEENDGHPLARLLTCHVLRRIQPPRVEEEWSSAECPNCGATAALAVLADEEGGRRRMLACACCQTMWRFKRVGCPYCGDESPQSVLQLDDEQQFRVDACESCKAYVKTYAGGGDVKMFLADWPTLHLDVMARDRGYQRPGASLYDL